MKGTLVVQLHIWIVLALQLNMNYKLKVTELNSEYDDDACSSTS